MLMGFLFLWSRAPFVDEQGVQVDGRWRRVTCSGDLFLRSGMWVKGSDLISMWVGGMGLVPSYLATYLDASVGARQVPVAVGRAAGLCT